MINIFENVLCWHSTCILNRVNGSVVNVAYLPMEMKTFTRGGNFKYLLLDYHNQNNRLGGPKTICHQFWGDVDGAYCREGSRSPGKIECRMSSVSLLLCSSRLFTYVLVRASYAFSNESALLSSFLNTH